MYLFPEISCSCLQNNTCRFKARTIYLYLFTPYVRTYSKTSAFLNRDASASVDQKKTEKCKQTIYTFTTHKTVEEIEIHIADAQVH